MGVHSLTLTYTLESMKFHSWAYSWPAPFPSPCLSHEPKAEVVTTMLHFIVAFSNVGAPIVHVDPPKIILIGFNDDAQLSMVLGSLLAFLDCIQG